MEQEKKYDVFISSKSEDYPIAEKVYDFLVANGLSVFLASRELNHIGKAEYSEAVDSAIDATHHMIVVTTSIDNIKSKWVKHEWTTFANELRSNYKEGNLLTILGSNVQLKDLPITLRHKQSFSVKSYKENILDYLYKDKRFDDTARAEQERLRKEKELQEKIAQAEAAKKELEEKARMAEEKARKAEEERRVAEEKARKAEEERHLVEEEKLHALEDIATQELLLDDNVRASIPESKVHEIVKLLFSADGISSKYQERFVQDLKYGLATAQNNLGFALEDPKKKVKWLEKAVKNGSGVAMITLGKMYAYGEGVDKNPNKALDYFRAASSNGYHDEVVGDVKKLLEEIGDCDTTKQVNIPTVFEKILTNKLDDRIQRLEASAMMGDVGAMIDLANMYDDGIDVERNINKAIYYYRQAVVKGCHDEYIDDIRRLTNEKRRIKKDTDANVSVLESSNKRCHFIVNNIPFCMIQVDGGTFKMGAISRQRVDAFNRELPVREVTLSTYYIGETLVTQELWMAVMDSNPSYFNSDLKNPVEQVSWEDCQVFIQKLNQITGNKFRLPTEAEWEFAARGGINSLGYKYSGSNQIKEVAWQQVPNEEGKTHPVGLRRPNELGVYDMSGNVWEWCKDWFGAYIVDELVNPHGPKTGNVRVCRGGCWHSHERYCCVFFRSFRAPHENTSYIGLRLVMEVNENE